MMMNRRGMLALLPAAGLAACAGVPPTNYYRLAAVPGAPRATAAAGVAIRGVSIPSYLNQTNITRPSGAVQFATYGNELWAAPLPDLLQGAMVQNLGQRLPAANITATGGAIAAPHTVSIEINVLRFDPDASGQITLSAQIAVKSGTDAPQWVTRDFTASANPTGPAVADTVVTMSTLWGQLADQIAGMINP